MKNADMPAMPLFDSEGQSSHIGANAYCEGLTKREMFAMHMDAGELSFSTIEQLQMFIGREVDPGDPIDSTRASFEAVAKSKLMLADALLAELEK